MQSIRMQPVVSDVAWSLCMFVCVSVDLCLLTNSVVVVNVFTVILLYFMFLNFILYCGQL